MASARLRSVPEEVGVVGHSREDADGAGARLGRVAGALEGLPARLEEEALLGIDDIHLRRREAEERRIEQVDAFEDAACPHVPRLPAVRRLLGACRVELVGGEPGDALDARQEVPPQLAHVAGAGEASGEADDGHAAVRIVGVGVGHG